MPTSASTSAARSSPALRLTPLCCCTLSAIWRPIGMVGSRDVIGSWKTIPMSPPRTLRISLFDSRTRSRPSSSTCPAQMRPPGGSRRMTEVPSMVLPQPDSPTRPSVSPSATARLTPSTARTVASRSRISTRRSLISRTLTGARQERGRSRSAAMSLSPGPVLHSRCAHRGRARAGHARSPEPDVEQVTQRVADEIEGHHDHHDEHADRVDLPPVTGEDVAGAVG